MRVDELIEKLMKIEDKTKKVYFDDYEWGSTQIEDVVEDEGYWGHLGVVLK